MNIPKMQTWALRAGFSWLAIAVLMTGAAGWSFGEGNVAKQFLFMLGFPLITIAAACLLPFLELCFEKRAFGLSLLVGLAWVVCTLGEGFGHLMIVAGQRDKSVQTSNVANVNWEAKKKAVEDLENKIKFLDERDAKFREANPFVTTMTADGLRATLASANLAIEQEAKRGGCGKNCLLRTKERDEIQAKIDAIESINKLAAMRTSTTEGLAKARKELEEAKVGHSDAASQTKVVSKLFNASLNPNETQKEWSNLILELFFVACFLFGPMTLITVGVRDWNKPKSSRSLLARAKAWLRSEEYAAPASAPSVPSTPIVQASPSIAREPTTARDMTGYVIVNDDEARRLKDAIRNAIAPRRLSAA